MISLLTLWAKLFLRLHGKSIRNSKIDHTAWVHYEANIVNSEFGRYSYCGYNCWVINAQIGAFCSIGTNVRIGGAAHPITFASSSPVFHQGKNVLRKNFAEHEFEISKQTIIGNDVWIADNVLIKAGVQIGDGAVIGMGSVVTHDVGAYEIWGGNPARMIRKRFSDDIIVKMLASEWWKLSDEKIQVLGKYMNKPEELLRRIYR